MTIEECPNCKHSLAYDTVTGQWECLTVNCGVSAVNYAELQKVKQEVVNLEIRVKPLPLLVDNEGD